MFSKLNLFGIVADHVQTLRSFGSDRPSVRECAWFFGLPAVFSVVQVWLNLRLSDQTVNVLVTAASIFAGLLLNLLVLLYTYATRLNDIVRQLREPGDAERIGLLKIVHQLLYEVLANISFSILASVLLVVFCLLFVAQRGMLTTATEACIYYLAPLLILSLLIVLKRIHALLKVELGNVFR